MANIFDFINAKEIALYIKNLPTETSLDKQLFPASKQYGMEIELAKRLDVRAKNLHVECAVNIIDDIPEDVEIIDEDD